VAVWVDSVCSERELAVGHRAILADACAGAVTEGFGRVLRIRVIRASRSAALSAGVGMRRESVAGVGVAGCSLLHR